MLEPSLDLLSVFQDHMHIFQIICEKLSEDSRTDLAKPKFLQCRSEDLNILNWSIKGYMC